MRTRKAVTKVGNASAERRMSFTVSLPPKCTVEEIDLALSSFLADLKKWFGPADTMRVSSRDTRYATKKRGWSVGVVDGVTALK